MLFAHIKQVFKEKRLKLPVSRESAPAFNKYNTRRTRAKNMGMTYTRVQTGTKRMMKVSLLWCVLLSAPMALGACDGDTSRSQVHYVRATAASGGDGTSWEPAYTHPQNALDAALSGDQVWVAQGVYGPLHPDRQPVLRLVQGVEVLGGFGGFESEAHQRDPGRHLTVLDGQGASYHVLTGANSAVLDGFTVTGGNADGNMVQGRYGGTFTGGGMFNAGVSPRVRNCIFTGNFAAAGGGAMYNEDNSPSITDCVFEYNRADFGGAIQNRGSAPEIINSVFKANESEISGGAVADFEAYPFFVNAVFSGNTSSGVGGAVLDNTSDAVFTNCSFTGNQADVGGGGIAMWRGRAKITNCILWDNRSDDGSEVSEVDGAVNVKYSIVKGGYAGTDNLDQHPRFIKDGQWGSDGQWIEGDYELSPSSPAVDSGTSLEAPDFDAHNNLRPQALAHDRGAYERTGM